jgi:acetolactate synthase-1/2/3 large subunit
VVNVTSGPGGINALNGVFGAWTDSIPMLVISGQVRYDTTTRGVGLPLRQMGDQEFDIARAVETMTKYAVMVTDPQDVLYELEKAVHLATTGRPGPVWVDIPLNIQGALVDEKTLRRYDRRVQGEPSVPPISSEMLALLLNKLRASSRPVLMVGTGVRLSGAYDVFLQCVERLGIPVVTAFNAHDLIPDEHPFYVGRPGTVGDRAGNFAVQNADLLIVLGCRLNIRQIGYFWQSFARAAYKVAVDIDALELQKPTVKIDLPIHGDLADFFGKLQALLQQSPLPAKTDWLSWCRERKDKYPVVLQSYWERTDAVNPYCFVEALTEQLEEGQITVAANGTACVATFQAAKIKAGQRLYTNSGSASMGYDLPAAIGACFGSGRKKVVCIAGDGSIQMNLQELATIRHYQLPIKTFVLNNNGYHSIRQTQGNFFGTPYVGVGEGSGLFFPSLEKIADVYEMQYVRVETHDDLMTGLAYALSGQKPTLCEVLITIEQPFAPKMSSKRLADGRMVSKPLEDLAPFLEREELQANMLIALLAD